MRVALLRRQLTGLKKILGAAEEPASRKRKRTAIDGTAPAGEDAEKKPKAPPRLKGFEFIFQVKTTVDDVDKFDEPKHMKVCDRRSVLCPVQCTRLTAALGASQFDTPCRLEQASGLWTGANWARDKKSVFRKALRKARRTGLVEMPQGVEEEAASEGEEDDAEGE